MNMKAKTDVKKKIAMVKWELSADGMTALDRHISDCKDTIATHFHILKRGDLTLNSSRPLEVLEVHSLWIGKRFEGLGRKHGMNSR